MVIERQNKNGFIDNNEASGAIAEFFARNDYTGKRILVIIPDGTRSGPVGDIFKIIFNCLGRKAKTVDCLVALGTHQPMTEERICTRLGMTPSERSRESNSSHSLAGIRTGPAPGTRWPERHSRYCHTPAGSVHRSPPAAPPCGKLRRPAPHS